VPPEFEDLPERVFFSDIHYLALVGEQARCGRGCARLAWREWDEPRIAEMLEFNDAFGRKCPSRPSQGPAVRARGGVQPEVLAVRGGGDAEALPPRLA
jgi:hypothetical protein